MRVMAVLLQDLAGQVQVVGGALAAGVVHDDGLPVAGRFAQGHVAVDHRVEHELLEVRLHFLHHLVGQAQAAVVHGEQHALDHQFGVQALLDDLDGVEQLAQPSNAKYSHCTGTITLSAATRAVHRNQAQGGRAVDDDEVVVLAQRVQHFLHLVLALGHVDHLDLSTHQVDGAGKEVEVRVVRVLHHAQRRACR
jgi:hypothetical protein